MKLDQIIDLLLHRANLGSLGRDLGVRSDWGGGDWSSHGLYWSGLLGDLLV
jgi:hypothetical protein